MSKIYKVLMASNEIPSYAFEEIESKINCAARDGFKPMCPIELYAEDRGDNAPTFYYVVVTVCKKEKKQKEDDSRNEAQARKTKHRKARDEAHGCTQKDTK